jgi:hypothetical protein
MSLHVSFHIPTGRSEAANMTRAEFRHTDPASVPVATQDLSPPCRPAYVTASRDGLT